MLSERLRSTLERSVRHLAIRIGLEAVALSGADRLVTTAAGRGVIFTLHHVRPERGFAFEPNGYLSVTPDFLDQALVAARDAGLHPVHLEQLPILLGDPSDKRKFVCLTLDDGYRDNARYAAPIFRKHRVPYTIFVTPGLVDRTRTMWWETAEVLVRTAESFRFDFGNGVETVRSGSTIEKWVAFERLVAFVGHHDEDEAVAAVERAALESNVDGRQITDDEIMSVDELKALSVSDELVSLGAHTLTHANLARVGDQRLQHELQSAIQVGTYCGRLPRAFAYPYGGRDAVGARETAAARECGYTVAVTTQPGVLDAGLDATALPRVSLNGHFQKKRYVRALLSGLPFKLM
jgi:peptidoglycan/xylan/chitin deacetylase (PgdA/CDA1 family)